MAKNPNLLAALKQHHPAPEAPETAALVTAKASPQKAKAAKPEKATASRADKAAMTNWIHPAFPPTLDLLKAQLRAQGRKATREELLEEALNLLFERYNVPTVSK